MKLENFITDLRSTSKPKEKLEVVKKYESDFLKILIHATYEPFKLYHVNIKKEEIPEPGDYDLTEKIAEVSDVLSFCESSNSNKQNRERVVTLLAQLNGGSQELLVGTLNKNWKAGLSTKGLLKLYPKIFSQFEVQLANTYDPTKEAHKEVLEWFASFKLDGLRCVALRKSSDEFYDKGYWTLYSRQGKEFLTVNHLKEQLEALYQRTGWTFFDGELYKHGIEFETIQGLVMGFTRGQAPEIEYHVFVAGQAEKFLAGEDPNHVTILKADSFFGEGVAPDICYVGGELIREEEIQAKLESAFEQGYEGIMLRNPDQLYDYKRSHALLKLKRSLTDIGQGEEIISDCKIIDIECGDFPVIDTNTGVMSYENLILRFFVEQENGVTCKVGSGFTLDFRHTYTLRINDLIGKTAEIKHQKWGSNGRMRFPRLHRVREDL